MTRFHSVMLSPDSVRRVRPPTTTMANTRPDMTKRWVDIAGDVRVGRGCVDEEEEEEDEEEEELPSPASAAWPRGDSGAVEVDCGRASKRVLLDDADLSACRRADMLELGSRVLLPGGVLVAKVLALPEELEPDSREDQDD